MLKNEKLLLTGANGLVGHAIIEKLKSSGVLLLSPKRSELDLTRQNEVFDYFKTHQPAYVIHLAAKVGGIAANQRYPGEFIYQNTQMQLNIIHAAQQYGIKKLVFPGSACTYPKSNHPINEMQLLKGEIESTNLPYGVAKLHGIIMAQAYAKEYGLPVVLPMPTNVYGPRDNFNLKDAHVIPAMIERFHQAKVNNLSEVSLWGSGNCLREFIYADDLADAIIFLLNHYDSSDIINVGSGEEIKIAELAHLIANVVGYKGEIHFDTNYPDGASRKLLDSSKLNALGWSAKINLNEGITRTYASYLLNACRRT